MVGTEEGADEVYDIDDEGAMIKLKRVLKRDATELAVTTSISHPNIVQVGAVAPYLCRYAGTALVLLSGWRCSGCGDTVACCTAGDSVAAVVGNV